MEDGGSHSDEWYGRDWYCDPDRLGEREREMVETGSLGNDSYSVGQEGWSQVGQDLESQGGTEEEGRGSQEAREVRFDSVANLST